MQARSTEIGNSYSVTKVLFLSRPCSVGCFLCQLDSNHRPHSLKGQCYISSTLEFQAETKRPCRVWGKYLCFACGSSRWLIHHHLDEVSTYIPTKDLYFFLVLNGKEDVKQRSCPSQRHVVFKSSGCCVGR